MYGLFIQYSQYKQYSKFILAKNELTSKFLHEICHNRNTVNKDTKNDDQFKSEKSI